MRSNGSQRKGCVENMFITDECGDAGMYYGETNGHGNAHGKGRMKNDNRVIFEGKQINGTCVSCVKSDALLGLFCMYNIHPQSHQNGYSYINTIDCLQVSEMVALHNEKES